MPRNPGAGKKRFATHYLLSSNRMNNDPHQTRVSRHMKARNKGALVPADRTNKRRERNNRQNEIHRHAAYVKVLLKRDSIPARIRAAKKLGGKGNP